jgi:hypothetical protein
VRDSQRGMGSATTATAGRPRSCSPRRLGVPAPCGALCALSRAAPAEPATRGLRRRLRAPVINARRGEHRLARREAMGVRKSCCEFGADAERGRSADRTVKARLASLMRKLGARNRVEGSSSSATTLLARIAEARDHAWLGEVEGLQILDGARQKLAHLDQIANQRRNIPIGMPTFTDTGGAQYHRPQLALVTTTPIPAMSDLFSAENKRGFGFHPLWAFVDHGADGTGEPLSFLLRKRNAGSNTAADHITVVKAAFAQLPGYRFGRRPGRTVLIRADGAGAPPSS